MDKKCYSTPTSVEYFCMVCDHENFSTLPVDTEFRCEECNSDDLTVIMPCDPDECKDSAKPCEFMSPSEEKEKLTELYFANLE